MDKHSVYKKLGEQKVIVALCILHSLFVLRSMLVTTPNVFMDLGLPLDTPTKVIRTHLLQSSYDYLTPELIGVLANQFESFSARVAYIRLGHSTVTECNYCVSFDDFALFSITRPLLEYARLVVLLGLMSLRGTRREAWRYLALGLVAILGVAELYHISTRQIPTSSFEALAPLHDQVSFIRRLVFLVLPAIFLIVPARRDGMQPLDSLPQLVERAERIYARLQLEHLTSEASLRNASLLRQNGIWWKKQRIRNRSALADDDLLGMARRLDLGVEEHGTIRNRARIYVGMMLDGLRATESRT